MNVTGDHVTQVKSVRLTYASLRIPAYCGVMNPMSDPAELETANTIPEKPGAKSITDVLSPTAVTADVDAIWNDYRHHRVPQMLLMLYFFIYIIGFLNWGLGFQEVIVKLSTIA